MRLFSAPGEVVLDCFVGSGTTPVAAIHEDRQYLGIDLLPEYVALAKRNCHRRRSAAPSLRAQAAIHVPLPQRGDHRGARPPDAGLRRKPE